MTQTVASPAKPIVKRARPIETTFSAVVILFALIVIYDLVTNKNWHWDIVFSHMFDPRILRGLTSTIALTLTAALTGLIFGLLVASMRLSDNRLVRAVAGFYVGFTRAVPALVLLLLIFYAAAIWPSIGIGIPGGPMLFEIDTNSVVNQFMAGIIGLTIILAAHIGEIIRGAIMSVDPGQAEAAKALGMPPSRVFFRVVFPQAIRVAVPAIANELISLFKNTSLVSIIGLSELLTVTQAIYSVTFQTIPMLLVACLWYAILTTIAMFGQRKLEEHFGRGQ